MDRREEVLKEILVKNDEERKRWKLYQKENETAIENLDIFGKKLTIDVMVPIGTKALLPGQIYHTNEVFISHFSGMFSKCSAFQAKTICNHRIKLAKEQLEKLKVEQEMFQNKLELPRTGVLASEGEQEIIEEYDEEKEKLWREQHKRSLRKHKQKEREQAIDKGGENNSNDVMKMLEELELMEELDEELDQLQIEDDEELQKLLSGKIIVPMEKKRISHYSSKLDAEIEIDADSDKITDKTKEKSFVEEISEKYKTINVPNIHLTDFTNNNSIPNSDDFHHSDTDSDDSLSADIPEEVAEAEKETENLSKKHQLRIFKNKLKQTEKSLKNLKIQNMEDLHRKAHLLEIREYFMDYVEILKDEVEALSESSEEEGEEREQHKPSTKNVKYKKKKSISFALEDQVKIIDRDSTVNSIYMEETDKQRDVITLDPTPARIDSEALTTVDKKAAILEKVERSCTFIAENQSQQDFDLVEKILSTETNAGSPLRIEFNHSNQEFQYPGYEVDYTMVNRDTNTEAIIGSPADIYRLFCTDRDNLDSDIKFVNNRENLDVNAHAYEDPRIQIFSSNNDKDKENKENLSGQKSAPETTKSILKNKDAVKEETRLADPTEKKEKRKKKSLDEQYAGFDMVMGDIVENQITQPDPLPKDKFVDARAPKKRISRFKQMRST